MVPHLTRAFRSKLYGGRSIQQFQGAFVCLFPNIRERIALWIELLDRSVGHYPIEIVTDKELVDGKSSRAIAYVVHPLSGMMM